eukprot:5901884-Pleurochrysis_carterae.AAC.1
MMAYRLQCLRVSACMCVRAHERVSERGRHAQSQPKRVYGLQCLLVFAPVKEARAFTAQSVDAV